MVDSRVELICTVPRGRFCTKPGRQVIGRVSQERRGTWVPTSFWLVPLGANHFNLE